MQVKTPAIVLHLSPHTDRASILHTYTRAHGRVPYLVYGLGSKTKRGMKTMCEPLSLVQVDMDYRSTRAMQQFHDISPLYVPQHLRTDMSRRCVALFIAEVLSSTLTYPMADEVVFDFLADTICRLDTCSDPENEHLRFLLGYIELLGFGIDWEQPKHEPLKRILTLEQHALSRSERQELLEALLSYYAEHLPSFPRPKSLDILKTIFD